MVEGDLSGRGPTPGRAPEGEAVPGGAPGEDPLAGGDGPSEQAPADGLTEHAPVGIQDQRKFGQRVLYSLVAGVLIILAMLAGDWGMTIGLMGACWFASRELFNLFEAKGYNPARNLGIVSCLAIMLLTQLSGTRFHGAFLTAVFVMCFVFLIVRGAPWFPYWNVLERFDARVTSAARTGPQVASISDVATTFLGILYTGWLPSFIILLRKFDMAAPVSPEGRPFATPAGVAFRYPDGLWLTLLYFLAVVATDVGAYFFGKFFGRRPLIGPLSPRKTIEGAFGGIASAMAVATLVGVVADMVLPRFGWPAPLAPWWQCTILGFIVSVTAQVSDLSESMIKRDVGRRDAGELIPGHGGMLDRVDSYLLSGAVAYWYILYFWKLFPWRIGWW
ncbi:MAG: phosphatidate cytidylyltransferase [Candidatus Sericytochromatia bacterium]|nr:phosphatidate cytidylyltransferase [Candidatus Tanganyikabacteria bacterium]